MVRLTKSDAEAVRNRFVEITQTNRAPPPRGTVTLAYPGHVVSQKPIVSWGYANCNGVAILGYNIAGLSHYDTTKHKPEIYVTKLLSEVTATNGDKDLVAVLLGGDPDHYKKNREILRQHGIPIMGGYLDGWADDGDWYIDRKLHLAGIISHKDILIVPETQEVIVHMDRTDEFIKLNQRKI